MKIKYEVKFTDTSSKFMKDLEKKFKVIMFQMEADARRLAPIDTGLLRRSISLRRINPYHYIMSDNVDYGIYNEFGTYKMRATPFFRPSLSMAKFKVKKMLK